MSRTSCDVARKARKKLKDVGDNVKYLSYGLVDAAIPFKPNLERYGKEFLLSDSADYTPFSVPKIIYVFWTGDNHLTPNRIRGLADLRAANNPVRVELVDSSNLDEHLIDGHPVHPAYRHLSLNHRSDYLRCYFMKYKGGGYSDIKSPNHSWTPIFERLENLPDFWGVGYPEESRDDVAHVGGSLERDLKRNYRRLAGNGAFVFRPHTPLVSAWFAELNHRLDEYYPQLKRFPGGVWGDVEGYPIPWSGLAGDIFHPLVLKYSDRMLLDTRLRPVLKNYR